MDNYIENLDTLIAQTKSLIEQNSDNFEEYVENHGRDTEEMEESIWGQQQKRLYKKLDNLIKTRNERIKKT